MIYRLAYRLPCAVRHVRYSSTPSVPKPSHNPITRAITFIRNDPFTRVSIMFGGAVLAILLVVESFVPKPQKRVKPQIALFPPRSTHPVINRTELETLKKWIPTFYSMSPSVAMVTGPSGCGKTELANQFAHVFVEHCTPRIIKKPSKQPMVLYVDGSDNVSMIQSVNLCAHVLGVKSTSNEDVSMDTVLDKLTNQKARWLLIVDNVSGDTKRVLTETVDKSGRGHRRGMILMTSSTSDTDNGRSIQLPARLSPDDVRRLFSKVSSIGLSDLPALEDVPSSPMGVALAALTVRVYNYFYNSPSESVSAYLKMIEDKPHPLTIPVQLFIDAMSSCDVNYMQCIDFIGSCDQTRPLPVCILRQHLKHLFLKGSTPPNDIFSSSTEAFTPAVGDQPSTVSNYLSLIKGKLPGFKGSAPQENILQRQTQLTEQSSDPLRSTIMSPFIRVSDVPGYDVQTLHVHSLARELIADNFINNSIDVIEENEVKRAHAHWDRTAMFKKYRTFDPNQALVSFRASLPGLREGRVPPEHKYETNKHGGLSYTRYIHMVSHYNRVITSVTNELRYLQAKDTENQLIKKYLQPHLVYLHKQGCVTGSDSLRLETAILGNTLALSDSTHNKTSDVCSQYERLLEVHVQLHGSRDPGTAALLNKMADLYYQNGDHTKAIELLKQAIAIYDSIEARVKTTEQCADHASSLSLLGHVHSAAGNRKECIKSLEQSMMIYQNIPSDNDITKSQRKVVAATVTDLGHAYIMSGDFTSAKKYLDLAVMAQKGIHGNYHSEVVRVLNIQSVVYALMGSNEECRATRREAGAVQKELELESNVV